jgi:sigma-E factor negative regulatory protein RseC
MAHTRGLVIKIIDDEMAQVATDRKNACSGCSSSNNCRSCLSNSKMVMMSKALNSAGAKEGDLVDISLKSSMVFKGAMVMYLIPIAGLLTGAVTGASVRGILGIEETISSIIFGIGGLCLGFAIVAFISKWMSANNRLTPTISRIIKPKKGASPSYLNPDLFHKSKECPGCH